MEFYLGTYSRKVEQANMAKYITICDSTLRDGEQAGVKYTLPEKIRIVKLMDEARIPEIQIASLRDPSTIEEAKAICNTDREYSKIEIMSRSTAPGWKKELEGIAEIGADIMHTLVPLSPWLRGAYGKELNNDELINRIREAVTFGKSLRNQEFNLSFLDATRTDERFLHKAICAGVEAGADRICIADTVGCFTPEMTSSLIYKIKSWLPKNVKLRVHVHNDFGLATANALAAAVAGADMIDTCINGRGKRAGNADMVQVMMGLKAFYGMETGIKEEKAYKICKEIEKLSGIPIPSNTPFTGDLVFADDSEYHIRGLAEHPFAFQAIDPTNWGNPRRILIGKNSGLFAMRVKIEQLGFLQPNVESIEEILDECKKQADQLPRGKYLTDQMIIKICNNIIKQDGKL